MPSKKSPVRYLLAPRPARKSRPPKVSTLDEIDEFMRDFLPAYDSACCRCAVKSHEDEIDAFLNDL